MTISSPQDRLNSFSDGPLIVSVQPPKFLEDDTLLGSENDRF
jgi:hypothetical protein